MGKSKSSPAYFIKQYSSDLVLADGSPAPPAVLRAALTDEDAEVSVCAALGLVKAGDLSAPVFNRLFDATDWRRDPEAADRARWGIVALGKTNAGIAALLLAALAEQRRPLAGVAQCLGEIGQAAPDVKPAIIEGLLAYVRQEPGADRYALASALGSLVRLGYIDDAVIDWMLALYVRGDVIVRRALLHAAGEIQPLPTQLTDLLLQALEGGGSEASAAARALAGGEIDRLDVVAALLAASGSGDWQLRAEAVGGLGAITDPTPVVVNVLYDTLYDALIEPVWLVRVHAKDSLGRLGPAALADHPKVTDRLHTLLAGAPMASERGTVALTLAGLGEVDAAVTAAFLAELSSPDASVRERIIRNWWLLVDGVPELLAHLYAALDDPEEMVRTSAAASLKRLGR